MTETPFDVPEALPTERRDTLLTRFARLRRGPWEGLATIVIGAGIVMLLQSWSMSLYTWSFLTILAGTALFVIVSHFKD